MNNTTNIPMSHCHMANFGVSYLKVRDCSLMRLSLVLFSSTAGQSHIKMTGHLYLVITSRAGQITCKQLKP